MRIFHCVIAIVCTFVASPALRAEETAPYAAVGYLASAPIGWVEFCKEHKKECRAKSSGTRSVTLTAKRSLELVTVNSAVNKSTRHLPDQENWGVRKVEFSQRRRW